MPKGNVKKVAEVSDHALIRYLERAKGFDFSKVREKIRKAGQTALDAGAASITVDGVNLFFNRHGVVTTAYDKKAPDLRKTPPKTVIPAE